MSKFLKNHKKDFIMWGLVLLIFGLIFLIVYYENKDKKHYTNVVCNSDINIVDDQINLDKNYYIDENGNIVSDNFFGDYSFRTQIYTSVINKTNESIVFNVTNSTYSYVSYLFTNLPIGSYTISFSLIGNINFAIESDESVTWYNNINNGFKSYTFNVSTNNDVSFGFGGIVGNNISISNIMLNSGSSALSFEPYGTWFKNEGQNYSVLYNIFNNSVGKLYRQDTDDLVLSESIVLSADDVSISMSNFPNIFSYLNGYDSEDSSTYPTRYFYFTIDLSGSTNSPLVFSLNNAILDTDISLYYNGQMLSSFSRDTDNYHIFVNQNSNYTFNEIYYASFYVPDYVDFDFNISSSGILYNKGYSDGVDSIKYDYEYLQTQYSNLQIQYDNLDSNYQSLLEQYNALNSDEFSLSSLIWDITAVPFNFIASGFNVNIMGLNIASIITGLFTACIVIWLFKKLFK